MPASQMSEFIQHLRRAGFLEDVAQLTDGQLLESFVSRKDTTAVEALVRRHCPMVWGVCRRILGNHHDAEDAFQATFVVLVRKAASIRTNVGNWLYGVAHQTALKARATRAKRKVRETSMTGIPEPTTAEQELCFDLQALLDREISRLPDKYRTVLVLCDLEGKSGRAAAGQLGCPTGTVASRLARARAMLAKRLARSGLTMSSVGLAGTLSQASASAPAAVLSSTINAVTAVAEQSAAAGAISSTVAALTEGVIQTMWLNKFMKTAAVLGVIALGFCGAGWLGLGMNGAAQEKRTGPKKDVELQEVSVQHPKQIETAPIEEFTGHLGKVQGDSIAVSFDVDERSYILYQRMLQKQRVKGPGSPLFVGLVDEVDFPHEGTFTGFGDSIDSGTGALHARGSIPKSEPLLLPGMFVRVRMPFGPSQKMLQVPVEAVLTDLGNSYVLIVTSDDIVERRAVTLGAVDGNMRNIAKGVGADDWIVVGGSGLKKVAAGDHVKRRVVGSAPKEKKDSGQGKPQQQNKTVEEIFKLEYAAAAEVAKALDALFANTPGPTFKTVDYPFPTNAVIVKGTREELEMAEAVISKLEDIAEKRAGASSLCRQLEKYKWPVTAVDPEASAISLRQSSSPARFSLRLEVAKDAKIVIDGRDTKLADVPRGAQIVIQIAKDRPTITRIEGESSAPSVLKAVDAANKTITVNSGGQQWTAPVADGAAIAIRRQAAKLSDLKAGMFVYVELAADNGRLVVKGIQVNGQ